MLEQLKNTYARTQENCISEYCHELVEARKNVAGADEGLCPELQGVKDARHHIGGHIAQVGIGEEARRHLVEIARYVFGHHELARIESGRRGRRRRSCDK